MPLVATTRNWRDIDLTLARVPRTGDVLTKSGVDAVRQHLRHLLHLNKYDVPFHPEISAGLTESLFELNTGFSDIIIEKKIRNLVEAQEPRVTLLPQNDSDPSRSGVHVSINRDGSEVTVTLRFTYSDTTEVVTFKTVLKRVR